ncbi:MAG: pyruvate ferredoxin oxidoreductase [Candidatus Aenigmatarchaeota archaeon]|nr:MAG: pyruvate ferredoxin oxidoreductase [Candidatus Aenigmarchaeota archaeon]
MPKAKHKVVPLTGNHAIAEAMRQINPDVVAAYPITPQSGIVEKFSGYVNNGYVDTEMIRVESEHSAMSACVGASMAGVRAMTATCSAGLALMWEIVGVASGLRCPIVMPVANRAISAPINIHCDHSDSMGARDLGWIQIYNETAQEAYENVFLALKLAEHPYIQLPVMVCEDGFVTSHCMQNVRIYDDGVMKKFVGERKPIHSLFDLKNPITVGAIELQDYLFETKRQQQDATGRVPRVYRQVARELARITGTEHGFFEEYHTKDAEAVVVTMSSAAGTTRAVVDELRKHGKKVGLLKIRLFRPFPYAEVAKALSHAKNVAVLDRSMSYGAHAPLHGEVMNALYRLKKKPGLQSYVFGLGGRDLLESHVEHAFTEMLAGRVSDEEKYLGMREERE